MVEHLDSPSDVESRFGQETIVVSYPGICCNEVGGAIWVTDFGNGRARKEEQGRECGEDDGH
jgi:hypothetical protein